MNITKYEHACLTVEEQGKLLIIDPGTFTTSLKDPENVVAIVLTHQHGDHVDPSAVDALIAHNPDARILAPQEVVDELPTGLPVKAIRAGQSVTVAPFDLHFYGGEHALIHESIPRVVNVGVLVNQTLYYPGDSFSNPETPVNVLALPVSGPWMKIGEAIDFLQAIKPARAFPTHDALHADMAQEMVDRMLQQAATSVGTEYVRLDPGQSLSVDAK